MEFRIHSEPLGCAEPRAKLICDISPSTTRFHPSHNWKSAKLQVITLFAGSESIEQALRSLGEFLVRRDEADDQILVPRKIIEVARMHGDAVYRQDIDRQILVRSCHRDF